MASARPRWVPVNAGTLGMAIAGLVVAVFSKKIDQRIILAVPTALLTGAQIARPFRRAPACTAIQAKKITLGVHATINPSKKP